MKTTGTISHFSRANAFRIALVGGTAVLVALCVVRGEIKARAGEKLFHRRCDQNARKPLISPASMPDQGYHSTTWRRWGEAIDANELPFPSGGIPEANGGPPPFEVPGAHGPQIILPVPERAIMPIPSDRGSLPPAGNQPNQYQHRPEGHSPAEPPPSANFHGRPVAPQSYPVRHEDVRATWHESSLHLPHSMPQRSSANRPMAIQPISGANERILGRPVSHEARNFRPASRGPAPSAAREIRRDYTIGSARPTFDGASFNHRAGGQPVSVSTERQSEQSQRYSRVPARPVAGGAAYNNYRSLIQPVSGRAY